MPLVKNGRARSGTGCVCCGANGSTLSASVVEEVYMRVMAKVSMDVERANDAIRSGAIGKLMQRTMERWHPEAAYFTTFDGRRTAFFVLDLPDTSDMPPFAEPFFMELGAEVQFSPAMNPDDLQKGLSKLD